MVGNWEFQVSTQIRFGWGIRSKLAQTVAQWGRRVFWVGYSPTDELETIYAAVRQQFGTADLIVQEWMAVDGEPDSLLVERGVEAAQSFGADVVVGIGGGSVLDVAKAVAAFVRTEGRSEEYLPLRSPVRQIEQALPIVAVPTTAGTGSEVTPWAVLGWQDPGQPDIRMKLTLASEVLTPKAALVDPELTVGCPARWTALGAADALGHAIEASLSRRASPLVYLLAEEAIVQIFTFLPIALARPEDRQAREGLALSATLAGIALRHAGATLGHSMAHAVGALAGVPHGLAVALVTPVALRYNLAECIPLAARWARRLGLPGQQPEELAQAFVERMEEVFRQADLPNRLGLPGPVQTDWPERLAQNAFQSTPVPLKLNPKKIDQPTLAELFQKLL